MIWWILGVIIFVAIVAVIKCDGTSGGGSGGKP